MDVLVGLADNLFFNQFYAPFDIPDDNLLRQMLTIFLILVVGSYLLYFICAGGSYFFFYDKSLEEHPKFLDNQIYKEIRLSVTSLPLIAVLTTPVFLLEVRIMRIIIRLEVTVNYMILLKSVDLFTWDFHLCSSYSSQIC